MKIKPIKAWLIMTKENHLIETIYTKENLRYWKEHVKETDRWEIIPVRITPIK